MLLLPLVTLGVYLAMLLLPRIDPRREAYALFEGAYGIIRLSTVAFLALVHGLVLLWVRGVEPDVAVVVPVLVGGLLVVIGNLLGKIRPNWLVGIKTPWTLASKRSWVKTHRLGAGRSCSSGWRSWSWGSRARPGRFRRSSRRRSAACSGSSSTRTSSGARTRKGPRNRRPEGRG
ncbi:SdpI family protein [Rubrobacter marinus]|uniref:SdpI family protein n=1 Tax=Rubrobacter marinus TaxID=2653852 RepID=UPI001A9E4665|nr:SdpI family protein [Rubrobacter marinus]